MEEYGLRRVAALAKSGELYRVRRGLYLPAKLWASLAPWEKYRVTIQAVHELALTPPVFSRESAAQIMGLPIIHIPGSIYTVVSPGRSGGQSSAGIIRANAIVGDPAPWELSGLRMTPPPQTARDLALRLPFTQALPAMDRVLLAKPLPDAPLNGTRLFTREDVLASVALLPNQTQRRRVERVLEFANGLSGSAGESLSRAVMILNGFPAPALQKEFNDSRGRIGFPDFDWEEFKLLGEFDGYEKYSAQRYLKGKTPSEVVVEEKKREDRLRAKGYKVVRWLWEDIRIPQRLIRLLTEAGLPQGEPLRH